jgi:outer membrane protein OmpA-like peptidoglycan-associated protein
MRKGRAGRWSPAALALAALALAGAGGCSSMSDAYNPVEWVKDAQGWFSSDQKKATEDRLQAREKQLAAEAAADPKAFPKLGTVPDRPPRSTPEERKQIADGLIADRANARYTDEQLRLQTDGGTRAPPPPARRAPEPARTAEPARAAEAPQTSDPPRAPEPARVTSQAAPVTATVQRAAPVEPPRAAPAEPPPAAPEPTPVAKSAIVDTPPPAPTRQYMSSSDPPASRPASQISQTAPVEAVYRELPAPPPPLPPEQTAAPPEPTALPPPAMRAAAGVRTQAAAGARTQVAAVPPPAPSQPPIPPPALPSIAPAAALPAPAAAMYASSARPVVAALTKAEPLPSSGDGQQIATVLFDDGSAEISPGAIKLLERVVALQRTRGGQLRVVGHASVDVPGGDKLHKRLINFRVSTDRANAVARELVKLGIDPAAISVLSVSESQPLYNEKVPAGEAGNRRAEIYLDQRG